MIFHIPHASTIIPPQERDRILLSDQELEKEILCMTDHYTDDLFGSFSKDQDLIVDMPVSRLVVDVERFEEDSQEEMSKIGMGCIYTHTNELTPLRAQLVDSARFVLLQKYYYPHHQALTTAVDQALDKNSCHALIIDCHSFPSEALPYESNQSTNRPDFCIGTDPFHTNRLLVSLISNLLTSMNYRVAINSPFAGSMVPSSHYGSNPAVESIMLEVNRSLYMDEKTGEKSRSYGATKATVGNVIEMIRCYEENYGDKRGVIESLGNLIATQSFHSNGEAPLTRYIFLYELNGAYYSLDDGIEEHTSLYSALIMSKATKRHPGTIDAFIEDSFMDRKLSDSDREEFLTAIDHRIQEWLGFHIPSPGTEDYDSWQSRVLDAEDIRSLRDVEYWAEMYTSGDLIDFLS